MEKKNSGLFSQILVALVIAIVAGSTAPWWWSEVKRFFEQPRKPNRCDQPWEWDTDFQSCVRKVTVPPKTISIGPLDKPISKANGRIDFYANIKRLPGVDSGGRAMYSKNKGALQVVIPVMLGDRMVGVEDEVIYSTNEGAICKVSSLPETTGWLKKMRVGYSLGLGTDCKETGGFCQAWVVESGTRVQVKVRGLTVIIGKNCRFEHTG